jgi:hypothetical protein
MRTQYRGIQCFWSGRSSQEPSLRGFEGLLEERTEDGRSGHFQRDDVR